MSACGVGDAGHLCAPSAREQCEDIESCQLPVAVLLHFQRFSHPRTGGSTGDEQAVAVGIRPGGRLVSQKYLGDGIDTPQRPATFQPKERGERCASLHRRVRRCSDSPPRFNANRRFSPSQTLKIWGSPARYGWPGRAMRFDANLVRQRFQGRRESRNRLKTERVDTLPLRRYQHGSLIKLGKRGQQMWYGVFPL